MKLRGFLLLIVTFASLAACRKDGGTQRTSSARVDYVNGEVTVNDTVVAPGDVIPPVFTVVTLADSSVGIIFDEKNILHVDADTEAYIDLASDVRSVELRKGTLASALRKLAQVTTKEPERFRVKTPTTVAGVRGTVFFVKVEDPATTYVCTCNGTLHLGDARLANPFDVTAAHHEAHRFTLAADTVTSSAAPMLYHTDQMMELGAQRIGETIDWSKADG